MHLLPFLLLPTTLLLPLPSVLALGSQKILLSKVKSLTLRSTALTTGRRLPPVPQLTCVGGNAQGLYDVDVMSCRNNGQGYDTEDIHWVCQASLPPEFKLGATDVVCEGYESAEDPWVLKGSCAVEYRLVLTPIGEEKYKSRTSWRSPSSSYHSPSASVGGLSDTLSTYIFWLFFIGVAALIIHRVCVNPNNPNRRGGRTFGNRNNFGGWGGGGGGGGPDDGTDDPPPPYTPRGSRPKSSPRYGASSAAGNSGPGFWTGTAAGAAAGYAASAWNARRNQQAAQAQQAGPSSWFGGGGGNGNQGYGMAGPSNYASAPAPSSSRHESTGFGGTRRR